MLVVRNLPDKIQHCGADHLHYFLIIQKVNRQGQFTVTCVVGAEERDGRAPGVTEPSLIGIGEKC